MEFIYHSPYRLWFNLCTMLRDRDYIIPFPHEDEEWFTETFNGDLTAAMTMLVTHRNHHDQKLLVVRETLGGASIGKAVLEAIIKDRLSDDVRRCILITISGQATAPARKVIAEMTEHQETPVFIELFKESYFCANLSQHRLLSRHSKGETKTVIDQLDVKPAWTRKTPRISAFDAQSRYLGLEAGQYTIIDRPSETAGRYVNIRKTFHAEEIAGQKVVTKIKKYE